VGDSYVPGFATLCRFRSTGLLLIVGEFLAKNNWLKSSVNPFIILNKNNKRA